jgi:hypothetical protein
MSSTLTRPEAVPVGAVVQKVGQSQQYRLEFNETGAKSGTGQTLDNVN